MNKVFVTPDEPEDNRIIGLIYESEIQSFAEANFGRELTDIELNRVAQGIWDDGAAYSSLMDVYHSAIEYALKEADWSATDSHYLNK